MKEKQAAERKKRINRKIRKVEQDAVKQSNRSTREATLEKTPRSIISVQEEFKNGWKERT